MPPKGDDTAFLRLTIAGISALDSRVDLIAAPLADPNIATPSSAVGIEADNRIVLRSSIDSFPRSL